MWVAGADGCKAGWVVVLRCVENGVVRGRVVPSVRALLALPEAPSVWAVDMPMGLPERAARGGRACDRAARQLLGHPRGRSVFSPPARKALQAPSYAAAQEVNRQSSATGFGLSLQTYHLFDKLRALDRMLTPSRQAFVREVHPEVSFATMNAGCSVAESKQTVEGRARRRTLLAEAHVALPDAVPGAAPDDLLDAAAACWTAGRIVSGCAECLPEGSAPTDARGLRMQIWR